MSANKAVRHLLEPLMENPVVASHLPLYENGGLNVEEIQWEFLVTDPRLSSGEVVIVGVANEIWSGYPGPYLYGVASTLDRTWFGRFLEALAMWREVRMDEIPVIVQSVERRLKGVRT